MLDVVAAVADENTRLHWQSSALPMKNVELRIKNVEL
jgi:hypothetical protein